AGGLTGRKARQTAESTDQAEQRRGQGRRAEGRQSKRSSASSCPVLLCPVPSAFRPCALCLFALPPKARATSQILLAAHPRAEFRLPRGGGGPTTPPRRPRPRAVAWGGRPPMFVLRPRPTDLARGITRRRWLELGFGGGALASAFASRIGAASDSRAGDPPG